MGSEPLGMDLCILVPNLGLHDRFHRHRPSMVASDTCLTNELSSALPNQKAVRQWAGYRNSCFCLFDNRSECLFHFSVLLEAFPIPHLSEPDSGSVFQSTQKAKWKA